MRKLLLLDANVIIDLHSLDLFEKVAKAYEIKIVREVFKEAKFYPKKNRKIPLNIKALVSIIEDVDLNSLHEVDKQAKEALLAIDAGEAISIAYVSQGIEDITFCTCEGAAIKLLSYMDLERKSISVEKVLKDIGQRPRLFPRHLESTFKRWIKEGKVLRIQQKNSISLLPHRSNPADSPVNLSSQRSTKRKCSETRSRASTSFTRRLSGFVKYECFISNTILSFWMYRPIWRSTSGKLGSCCCPGSRFQVLGSRFTSLYTSWR